MTNSEGCKLCGVNVTDYEKKSTQTVYLYTYQGIVSESLIPAD